MWEMRDYASKIPFPGGCDHQLSGCYGLMLPGYAELAQADGGKSARIQTGRQELLAIADEL